MTSPSTLLEALSQRLRGCYAHGDAESPVATLWTDPRSAWKTLIPLLRQQLPELVCLSDYAPEHQQGPALWLRCNLEVSGGTAGMTPDLGREAAGGLSVATTTQPVDDGGARLLVEDDALEGAAVLAVL